MVIHHREEVLKSFSLWFSFWKLILSKIYRNFDYRIKKTKWFRSDDQIDFLLQLYMFIIVIVWSGDLRSYMWRFFDKSTSLYSNRFITLKATDSKQIWNPIVIMKPTNFAPPTVPFIWFVNVFIATTPARTHSISVLKYQVLKLPIFLKLMVKSGPETNQLFWLIF